jgi:hypothetical protein
MIGQGFETIALQCALNQLNVQIGCGWPQEILETLHRSEECSEAFGKVDDQ